VVVVVAIVVVTPALIASVPKAGAVETVVVIAAETVAGTAVETVAAGEVETQGAAVVADAANRIVAVEGTKAISASVRLRVITTAHGAWMRMMTISRSA
jgi:hypothetical protein